ncbi:Carbon-nitrogen hydrolase [Basidiobolus ranarum]|uniref:Carbon-nitrogen hydrolase n=1 Tax=Basidiobolus ranarum TaxID=34480 RepID=A0ABR2WNX7_9FUNG
MSTLPKLRKLIAVAQFCATSQVENNLTTCINLIHEAKERGVKMVFFPEASDFIAPSKDAAFELTKNWENSFLNGIKKAATEHNMWVSIGVHQKTSEERKLYNSNIVISDTGSVVETYHKIHLFDVDIKNGPRLLESENTLAGNRVVDPVETPVGKVGLAICYDLRFPELSQSLRKKGAEIITYPSAFTVKTGQAHWEILLRSRAIETQTYIVAAAQIGSHNEKRESYGHAMIVDPWGTILARCPEVNEPSLAVAEINPDWIRKVRLGMPVLNHRRENLFG